MTGRCRFGLLVDGPGGYALAWTAVALAAAGTAVVTQVWRRLLPPSGPVLG